MRKVLWETPEKFDLRDWMKPARQAAKEMYVDRMKAFGQAGHATDYKPMTIQEMAEVYKATV